MSDSQLVAVRLDELSLAVRVDDLDCVCVVFPIGGENDADSWLPTTIDVLDQLDNSEIGNAVKCVRCALLIRRHDAQA